MMLMTWIAVGFTASYVGAFCMWMYAREQRRLAREAEVRAAFWQKKALQFLDAALKAEKTLIEISVMGDAAVYDEGDIIKRIMAENPPVDIKSLLC